VSFEVSADAYERFMGRYSERLAARFADLAGPDPGRVLDVGCGPGALSAELARRLGANRVTAVDPSASFVAAAAARLPDVQVHRAAAEELPFPDGGFGAALAQLVVQFMADPVAGMREMARVTRDGGALGACVWDHGPGGRGPISGFWTAALALDPRARDESGRAGTQAGELEALAGAAGWRRVTGGTLAVRVPYAGFEDWWHPFTLGVGPAGAHVAGLDPGHRAALREACRRTVPDGPFEVEAVAWTVTGTA
jgi:SAM-dependent methyltransferase